MQYSGERKVTKKLISCVKREEQKGEGREGGSELWESDQPWKVGKVEKVGQTLYTFIFATLQHSTAFNNTPYSGVS